MLLVSHTDPLFGDHLRGATTCPSPWDSLAHPPRAAATRRSAPGAGARAAATSRSSGGALARPRPEPVSAGAAAAWGRRADRPGEAGAREDSRPGTGSPRRRRRERGAKEEGNATSGPRSSPLELLGFGCQRQHWLDSAPRKCGPRLRERASGRGKAGAAARAQPP